MKKVPIAIIRNGGNVAPLRAHSDPFACARRSLLKALAAGTTTLASSIVLATAARASPYGRLWSSASVLIGNSPSDQTPSPFIQCPLFFDNGQFANAYHTLDLSTLPNVVGTIVYHDNSITPAFSSIAADVTTGSDGNTYLLVAGEGSVNDADGFFKNVTRVIIRCKYKIAPSSASILLIACIDCVVILVRV